MKRLWLAACLAALAACGPRSASDAPRQGMARPIPMGAVTGPSVYALLGHRERLELTSLQVGALDSIAEWLRVANRPLLAELGGDRTAAPPTPDPLGTVGLLQRIGENNSAAVAGVEALLTADQRTRVCEIYRASAEQERAGGERRGERRGPRRRGGEARADTLLAASRTPWSWCARAAAGGGAG